MQTQYDFLTYVTKRYFSKFLEYERELNYRKDNLKLDIYYPELMLAITISGSILEEDETYDLYKEVECKKRNIELIIIKSSKDLLKRSFRERLQVYTGNVFNINNLNYSFTQLLKRNKPKKAEWEKKKKRSEIYKKKMKIAEDAQQKEWQANKRRNAKVRN